MAAPAVEDFLDNVDECYIDDVVGNSSKLRPTKGFTVIFIIVMALALNEMMTKNDSMFLTPYFLFFPFFYFLFFPFSLTRVFCYLIFCLQK
jgi:hypothetical protein